MKLIIDIPKGTYEAIKVGTINQVLEYKVWDAIKNGTPYEEREKGEWIPISERLPKERQAVLCWAESTAERLDTEFIGMFDAGDWFLQSDANHLSYPHQYNVVAWMPLPKPYKAESEE